MVWCCWNTCVCKFYQCLFFCSAAAATAATASELSYYKIKIKINLITRIHRYGIHLSQRSTRISWPPNLLRMMLNHRDGQTSALLKPLGYRYGPTHFTSHTYVYGCIIISSCTNVRQCLHVCPPPIHRFPFFNTLPPNMCLGIAKMQHPESANITFLLGKYKLALRWSQFCSSIDGSIPRPLMTTHRRR